MEPVGLANTNIPTDHARNLTDHRAHLTAGWYWHFGIPPARPDHLAYHALPGKAPILSKSNRSHGSIFWFLGITLSVLQSRAQPIKVPIWRQERATVES